MAVQCFLKDSFPVSDRPCANTRTAAGFYGCCGALGVCLDNGLCHFTRPSIGGSGYYTQSCSDRTFSDPACNQQCVNQLRDDVVYNFTTNLWACCGDDSNGTPTCSDPTNYTFEAPSPQSLLAQTVAFATLSSASASPASSGLASTGTSIISSSSSATVSALSASSAAPSISTNKPLANDSGGLSQGAKAGFGIGAAAGALILLAALYLAFHRRIKKRGNSKALPANSDGNKETGLEDAGNYNDQQKYVHTAAKARGTSPAELPGCSATGELDAEREYWEMQ